MFTRVIIVTRFNSSTVAFFYFYKRNAYISPRQWVSGRLIEASAKAWTKARQAKEAATQSLPPVKKAPVEFQEAHDKWLARERRRDPVDVDTDVASHDWTNWKVKQEPVSKFSRLKATSLTWILLHPMDADAKAWTIVLTPFLHLLHPCLRGPFLILRTMLLVFCLILSWILWRQFSRRR